LRGDHLARSNQGRAASAADTGGEAAKDAPAIAAALCRKLRRGIGGIGSIVSIVSVTVLDFIVHTFVWNMSCRPAGLKTPILLQDPKRILHTAGNSSERRHT
jgi:hypothetical protein